LHYVDQPIYFSIFQYKSAPACLLLTNSAWSYQRPPGFLMNGTEPKLTLAEIPDPPVVSFVDNIPRLNQIWDDTSIHWREDLWLHIRGHPIALSHWPVLYKYSGAPTWKGIKGKFFEWKVSSDVMALTDTFHSHVLSLPRCLYNTSVEAHSKSSGQSSPPLLASRSRIW
jgi:hypothetical protein